MNRGFRNLVKIQADASGSAPKTIELLRTGEWHTPWHGDFEITKEDIKQFAANAQAGVGLVAADPRVPLNYGHASYDKAAGWIANVYVSEDGESLLGDPEWTPAAAQAIEGGEWKYISPEFNPRDWPWEDPEEEYHFVNNVITGAALTNIPLFKKLKPITASRIPPTKVVKASAAGDGDKNVEGDKPMDLAVIRAKKLEELSDEEKTFITENKAELTPAELKTFELVGDDDQSAKDAAAKEAADKEAADKAAQEQADADAKAAAEKAKQDKIEASKKGAVSISADRLAKLEASAKRADELTEKLDRKEAEDFIDARIKAGQIKSGERENTVKVLLASKGDQRTALETVFLNLNKIEVNGKELGDQGVEASADASAELHNKVALKIKASAAEGKRLSYYDAQNAILTEDTALAARVKDENKEDQ